MATRKKVTRKTSTRIRKPRASRAAGPPRPASRKRRRRARRAVTLEPTWVLTLQSHWRASKKSNRQAAIEHLGRAQTRRDPESCLRELREGLKALHLGEMGIIRLLLHQYLVLVSARRADPLKDMASQMSSALASFDPTSTPRKRAKRRRGKDRGG